MIHFLAPPLTWAVWPFYGQVACLWLLDASSNAKTPGIGLVRTVEPRRFPNLLNGAYRLCPELPVIRNLHH